MFISIIRFVLLRILCVGLGKYGRWLKEGKFWLCLVCVGKVFV